MVAESECHTGGFKASVCGRHGILYIRSGRELRVVDFVQSLDSL